MSPFCLTVLTPSIFVARSGIAKYSYFCVIVNFMDVLVNLYKLFGVWDSTFLQSQECIIVDYRSFSSWIHEFLRDVYLSYINRIFQFTTHCREELKASASSSKLVTINIVSCSHKDVVANQKGSSYDKLPVMTETLKCSYKLVHRFGHIGFLNLCECLQINDDLVKISDFGGLLRLAACC